MRYFVCALYEEAAPFIACYLLQKDPSLSSFQIFRNEDTALIITRSGLLNSSIATTYLLSNIPPSTQDVIFNVGVCGTMDRTVPLKTPFYIHKITDAGSGFTYYPDILFRHPFKEQEITTVARPLTSIQTENRHSLIDMESSGFFAAASHFLQPHQIVLIKVVSDYCDDSSVSPAFIRQCIEGFLPSFQHWTELFSCFQEQTATFVRPELNIQTISSNLKLSVTLQHELAQLIHYYTLEHGETEKLLEKLIQDSRHIKTKLEGKNYFEKLRHDIIS